MFYCYILYSASLNRYYVGSTGDDISERIRRHNSNHKGYTGKASDWALAYAEAFSSRNEAMQREREIKRWKSRQAIERLVTSSKS